MIMCMSSNASSSGLDGLTALVTGGGTGIGLGIARQLALGGAIVTIAGRRAETLRTAADALLAETGCNVAWTVCDVTDDASVAAAVAAAAEKGNGLDIAVANAGSGSGTAFLAMSTADLKATYEANVFGAFATMRESAKSMKESGGGSIIAISSIAGALGGRFRGAYASSKAALDMLVRVAADELGPFGVRVNSVRPGLVPSEVTAPLTSAESGPLLAVQRDYLDNMPISRLGTPDDIGSMVAFLASPAAGWITGQNIAVDGGHTLRRAPNMEAALRARIGDAVVDGWVGPSRVTGQA